MIRKTKRRTKHNKWWKLQVKDSVKALLESVKNKDVKTTEVAMSTLSKKVDKASKTGALPKNKANRMKARYQKLANATKKASKPKKTK